MKASLPLEKDRMRELVLAAQKQDAAAFSELYRNIYRSLYKTAFYFIGNAHDAEDVVMDTVADAYAAIGKLRVPEAFEGWIYRILYNKSRRKRGYNAYRAPGELPETLEADVVAAGTLDENSDLMAALAQLSGEERSIVVLSVCSGYSSAEVGLIMNLNPNTVRSKQMRALAKLRTIMTAEKGGVRRG